MNLRLLRWYENQHHLPTAWATADLSRASASLGRLLFAFAYVVTVKTRDQLGLSEYDGTSVPNHEVKALSAPTRFQRHVFPTPVPIRPPNI